LKISCLQNTAQTVDNFAFASFRQEENFRSRLEENVRSRAEENFLSSIKNTQKKKKKRKI
jgi:hypothetical protein